jgi:hypothetical protein
MQYGLVRLWRLAGLFAHDTGSIGEWQVYFFFLSLGKGPTTAATDFSCHVLFMIPISSLCPIYYLLPNISASPTAFVIPSLPCVNM